MYLYAWSSVTYSLADHLLTCWQKTSLLLALETLNLAKMCQTQRGCSLPTHRMWNLALLYRSLDPSTTAFSYWSVVDKTGATNSTVFPQLNQLKIETWILVPHSKQIDTHLGILFWNLTSKPIRLEGCLYDNVIFFFSSIYSPPWT